MKRLLLFAALLAWSGMASAVVYKWTDAQGKIQYGDRPPDGVHAEVVELLATHSAAGVARTAAAPSAPSAPRAPAAKPTQQDINDKKAIDQDVSQTRDKQCADAQDRYKKLIDGRHIYKMGPDGERVFMSSDEIDTERMNAKRDVDSICNSTT